MQHKGTLAIGSATLVAVLLFAGCGYQNTEEGDDTARNAPEATEELDPLTAQTYVDFVRIGKSVGADGAVAADMSADHFAPGEPIHISMKVDDAPVGSTVRVMIFDRNSDQQVWSDEKTVEAGQTLLSFAIDPDLLAQGEYRADVVIGGETVADRHFEVATPEA